MDTRPPNEVLVLVTIDYAGTYKMKAMRKDYKQPKKKGRPVGWRWVDEKGEALGRKHTPDSWEYIK